MASSSSISSDSSHPPSNLSELLSSLKVQIPDGYQVEEMLTIQGSEKINHHPNHISKTTQYSTTLCFKRVEENHTAAPINKAVKFEDLPKVNWLDKSKLHSVPEFEDLRKDNLLNEYKLQYLVPEVRRTESILLKELKEFRAGGFKKVRVRDFSHNAKERFGFFPRTNKTHRGYQAVSYSDLFGTSYGIFYSDAFDTSSAFGTSSGFDTSSTTFYGTIKWEVETTIKCFDNLPEGAVAMILAKLPTKDIYHGQSVCRAWKSIITTDLSFRSSFNESVHRRPWFLLLDAKASELRPKAVFNMETGSPGAWCQIELRIPIPTARASTHKVVVSSGGLICVWSGSDSFIVSNPFTGSSHHLPSLSDSNGGDSIKGMAMHVPPYSQSAGRLWYQIFLVIVTKDGGLLIKSYSATFKEQEHGAWKDMLRLKFENSIRVWDSVRMDSVIAISQEKQIWLHFVDGSGSTSVCCDISSGAVYKIPMYILSTRCSKASKLVVCNGSLFSVILSRHIRQRLTELQIYEYSSDESTNENEVKRWELFTTLPEKLTAQCCINKKDHDHAISCDGYGNYIMVYVICACSTYALMFKIKERDWALLPPEPSDHNRNDSKMVICSLMPLIN